MQAAIAPAGSSDSKVVVLLQNAAGAGIFDAAIGYTHDGADDPCSVAIANLGPDAFPDLVVANAYDGVYVFLQQATGTGSFSTGVKISD
ncbi:MAG: hypothetical protein R3E86_22190 [Pseudomonadales bacterium]